MNDKQSDYKPRVFYILKKHEDVIDKLAYMQKVTKSHIVRQIIDDFIETTKKEVQS